MGRAETLYAALMAHATMAGSDMFAAHVAASILALAGQEAAREGVALAERSGLDEGDQAALMSLLFGGFALAGGARDLVVEAQEQTLRDILWMNCAQASPFEHLAARMIARRAMRPNHLWQDLGLGHRRELTQLMQRHFPRLAQRNAQDMKWKKFFYRMMCSGAGFTLCAAPVCSECDDFEACFGAEDGEALLARIANGRGLSGAASAQGGVA